MFAWACNYILGLATTCLGLQLHAWACNYIPVNRHGRECTHMLGCVKVIALSLYKLGFMKINVLCLSGN